MTTTQDQINEDLRERMEHREVLLDIQSILSSKAGKNFVKYLLKTFSIGELPPIGLTGEILMDHLGFLRAGHSVFKLIAEASPEIAGQIIGQIEKDKNVQNDYDEARQGN